MRILIADDDRTSRYVLETALKRWGYDVVSTSDGYEAWNVLQGDNPPRLVIMDWLMPNLDGVQVCQRIRRSGVCPSIYIILLTILGRKDHIVEGLNAGADDYITKPFDSDELRARIRVGVRVLELQETLSDRVRDLESALAEIHTLRGIVPICTKCHRIRNDRESWQRLEYYIEEHSEAQFSHGLCPDCLRELYGEDWAEDKDTP